jgi:hypothetical protein
MRKTYSVLLIAAVLPRDWPGHFGCRPTVWVDILPGRVDTRVICLPKVQKNDWNCCREHWIC